MSRRRINGDTVTLMILAVLLVGLVCFAVVMGVREYGESQRCHGTGGTWAKVDNVYVCLSDYTVIEMEEP